MVKRNRVENSKNTGSIKLNQNDIYKQGLENSEIRQASEARKLIKEPKRVVEADVESLFSRLDS